jgi:hypothetical protein
MFVNGCDCSIVIKTTHVEKDIPYSNETLREAVSFLEEEASIEGGGVCSGIRKSGGVAGCVVTPLTIGTAPLLLSLAMGAVGLPVFVSETRNIYQYRLDLISMEDTGVFDLVQMRNEQLAMSSVANKVGVRRLYEGCRVKGFELRIMRNEMLKLKLDITSERSPTVFPYTDKFVREQGERFSGDCVSYQINGKEYKNIYGITLISKKVGGTKTELWIKRALEKGNDLPEMIEEIVITAQLLRDTYEYRRFGTFRITIKRLVLISDETEINAADTVIGPLRYYVAGTVSTEVFASGGEQIP